MKIKIILYQPLNNKLKDLIIDFEFEQTYKKQTKNNNC